jgi:hypothetical protein
MLSVLFAGNVMAQKLTVENISVDAGDVNDLVIGIETPEAVQAAQFTIVLPEGLSVEMDGEDYIVDALLDGADGIMPKRNTTVTATKKDDGIQIVAFNTKNVFTATSGNFVVISVEAAEGLEEGTIFNCKLVDIKAGSIDGTTVVPAGEFSDVAFQVGIGVVPTGINSLNAADSNAPVYNLAGQQVGKNYKGIVVKNGKKAIVK